VVPRPRADGPKALFQAPDASTSVAAQPAWGLGRHTASDSLESATGLVDGRTHCGRWRCRLAGRHPPSPTISASGPLRTPVRWAREPIHAGDLLFLRGSVPVQDYGHVGVALDAIRWINGPSDGDAVKVAPIPYRTPPSRRRLPLTR
jgi:hypothetical protein